MIINRKRAEIIAKRAELSASKKAIEEKIQSLGIPNYRSPKILELYPEQIKKQKRYSKQIHDIEKDLADLKNQLQLIPDDESEIFKKIIKRTFGMDFFMQVILEAGSQSMGNPIKEVKYISEENKELSQYKSKCHRLEKSIENSRKELTNYIQSFETKMTKSDYANFIIGISKLNKSIPHHSQIKSI